MKAIAGGLAALIAIGAGAAAAADLKPWKHGIIAPKNDAGFMMMVKEGGFAEKRGLDVTLVPLATDGLLLKALLAGELDSYEGAPGSAINAFSHGGGDLRIIGCSWPGVPHAIFAKQGITKPADLKGKNIAVSTPGSLPDLLVRYLLVQNGMSDKDAKFVNLGTDLDRFKALLNGVVDAAVASAEFDTAKGNAPVKLVWAGADIAPKFLRVCQITTATTLAKRGADVVQFLAADIEGVRHALAHPDEEMKVAREATQAKADDPRPKFMYDYVVQHHAVDPDLKVPLDSLNWMQDLLVSTGNLDKKADLTKLADEQTHAKALALVAK
jgi:NitT/TauT family transport system substrate-binding protein